MDNPQLLEAVQKADYVLPDGIGVIIASRILGRPLKGRVGGFDVACALLPLLEKESLSLYLLGAKPGVAEIAAENIRQKYPALRIVGTHDGYFKDEVEVIDQISALKPDMLYLGFGYPQEEIFMLRNREKIGTGVMMGLGGSIDIFAGVAKRAPGFFIKLNLEWFYRLLRQPSRFVRMLKLPKYIIRACAARLFKHEKKQSDD